MITNVSGTFACARRSRREHERNRTCGALVARWPFCRMGLRVSGGKNITRGEKGSPQRGSWRRLPPPAPLQINWLV